MREDPDVILVGELRDAETISMAMTAAETGHLVLGTLHTTSAVKTIDRIIDALPVQEREQTKSFLAQSLLAVVTQVLVKTADGHGRKAVCETLMMTKAIAKLIQTEQTHQIPTQLQMGKRPRHAAARPGAAGGHQRAPGGPGRRLRLRHGKARLPALRDRHQHAAEAGHHRHRAEPGHHRHQQSRLRLSSSAMAQIDAYLTEVLDKRGSDLHFIAGDPPRIRLYGDISPLRPERLAAEAVKQALYEIMPKPALDRFEAKDGADFAYSIPEQRALPRQRHAPGERHGRGVPRHPLQGAHHG